MSDGQVQAIGTVLQRTGTVQRRALFSSFIGWMFDGFETSTLILVGGVAAMLLLGNSTPDEIRMAVGIAIGATLMGWAIGGTIGSIMADHIGRKKMLMISIAGYCALTALTAFSPSWTVLIVLRFLTGMFLGSEWSTGTALVAETWPDKSRAKALGVMQSGYGFGFLLAAGLWLWLQPLWGPDAWRVMFVIGVLPALVLMYIRREVPESKLWLEAIKQSGSNDRTAAKGKSGLVNLFSDREAIGNAFATLVMATVTVSVFYGISALIGPYIGSIAAKQGLTTSTWASISALIYNGGSIVGYMSGGFIAERIGRKPYMLLMFMGAICSGVMQACTPETLTWSLLSVFILGIFTLGTFSWMPIYLPELFKTRVRSTASGVVFNLARIVSFPLPILTAFLFSTVGGYHMTVLSMTLLYFVAILALWFLPETRGKPLPN
ncbi:MFS transporter [Rhizobium tropici]|nr:MFS transporter [Rhizobium tropici]